LLKLRIKSGQTTGKEQDLSVFSAFLTRNPQIPRNPYQKLVVICGNCGHDGNLHFDGKCTICWRECIEEWRRKPVTPWSLREKLKAMVYGRGCGPVTRSPKTRKANRSPGEKNEHLEIPDRSRVPENLQGMEAEENGLDIVRAYDTIYGFILAQEVHVRAELFQNLDVLYHWARKHSPDSALHSG